MKQKKQKHFLASYVVLSCSLSHENGWTVDMPTMWFIKNAFQDVYTKCVAVGSVGNGPCRATLA